MGLFHEWNNFVNESNFEWRDGVTNTDAQRATFYAVMTSMTSATSTTTTKPHNLEPNGCWLQVELCFTVIFLKVRPHPRCFRMNECLTYGSKKLLF